MESSFFEYCDETGVDSDSEKEFVDNSLDESYVPVKTPGKKNRTVFIPESDDSTSGGESEEENTFSNVSKSLPRRSSIHQHHIVLSSDDDQNKRKHRQLDSSNNVVVSSSDDEGQVSPEMIPRRRLVKVSPRLSESYVGRKTKKRIMQLDSDTDNSILMERNKNTKLKCLKDTPIKIGKTHNNIDLQNMSIQSDSNSSNENEPDDNNCTKSGDDINSDDEDDVTEISDNNEKDIDPSEQSNDNHSDVNDRVSTSDEGPDEDQMVMSRATRMSIMGMIPKENDSDDSDYIQSDYSNQSSRKNSITAQSLTEIAPEDKLVTSVNKTPEKRDETDDGDTSRITCSPIASPLHDRTNEINNTVAKDSPGILEQSQTFSVGKENSLNGSKEIKLVYKESVIDDDITIIDMKPEIIALSSDDDEVKETKISPKIKKSLKVKAEDKSKMIDNNIKQYLLPSSYPNQQVVYVKKHVKENELQKLQGLREDLQNVRYILENMDVKTLPDGGVKLIQRLTTLEGEVRRQGEKVANMVVEPDVPTAKDIARDEFSDEKKGLSWEDIQKASNAVQPRMFGKQAMATHMAERNLIQDRLRDLYESLASRPAEKEEAKQPTSIKTELMPHQLYALTWLKWRETQRPAGGVLADDMGLGKTITMISLIVDDKETSIDDDDDDSGERSRLVRGGTLVVCPASLMQQWAGEVKKHCISHTLSVCLHHGSSRATQPHRLASNDLVMTTYNILQRESEKNGVLTRILWRRVILDEAHAVRNHKSATSQAVCGLRSKRRWALTGTPLHNKDLDLFALLKFLKCTPFDDLKMWQKWIDNKSLGGQERLSIIMRSLMLRRTKQQLQEIGQLNCLPERTAHQVDVTLSKDEMNVYQKVLVFSKTLFAQFLHQRAEKQADSQGFLSAGKNSAYDKVHKKMIALQGAKPVKSHEILVLLLRLRQVCCHCGLIASMLDPDDTSDVMEDAGGQDLLAELNKLTLNESKRKSIDDNEEEQTDGGTTVAEAIRSVLSPNNPVFNLQKRSSKIKAVIDCLNENVFPNKGEKAVVVSQWTSVLSLVERELTAARVKCVTLSGSVAVPARAALIDTLNDAKSDVKVMLLSLCAGGVGLNLCGANHLLLLDPHWNPQLEEQAQDRVYRVGQHKNVHIYKFMCVDTVEQSIRKLQQAKLALAESVLTGARNTNASKLTIEDLKVLFNMGSQAAT